jgi:hypothetical protein
MRGGKGKRGPQYRPPAVAAWPTLLYTPELAYGVAEVVTTGEVAPGTPVAVPVIIVFVAADG